MRQLEEKYEAEIVVVGVHSGKYHAERVTERIRHASFRLRTEHPIVNDRQFRVWRSYAVSAWPTLVVLDPAGYVVGARAGEFTAELLSPVIEELIMSADEKGILDRTRRLPPPDRDASHNSYLRYPGKVAVDGARIAIADSGHDRILLGVLSDDDNSIKVEHELGGKQGFADGANAAFNYPQGVRFSGNKLYVADTGNHAIREVSLDTRAVSTIAGTGEQIRTMRDIERGALSSPWDVDVHDGTLYIAMAGRHQLWSLDLKSGKTSVHAGTGGEDIRDGVNREALLAQPMGMVASHDTLYAADAESSAIRSIDYSPRGETRTIVGTALFDFGDKDGTADNVRMQHQQGVALAPNGKLIVADTYNDSLKWVDPVTRTAKTWVKGFSEPAGIAAGENAAFVADTNAHRIVRVSYETGDLVELSLK